MSMHKFRITKYDPKDRDPVTGYYTGTLDTDNDEGPIEEAYVQSVRLLCTELGVTELEIRGPVASASALDLVDSPIVRAFIEPDLRRYYDGARVSADLATELVRSMLRGHPLGCELVAEGRLRLSLGWDLYMYADCGQDPVATRTAMEGSGVFIEPTDWTPREWKAEDELSDYEEQIPANDQWWAELRDLVLDAGELLFEHSWAANHSVFRVITADNLAAIRAGILPRARLYVWPALVTDSEAIRTAVEKSWAEHKYVNLVWRESDDDPLQVRSFEGDGPREVFAAAARATAAYVRPSLVDECYPIKTGINPDPDGEVRARFGCANAALTD